MVPCLAFLHVLELRSCREAPIETHFALVKVIFCENDTHDARATFGALSPYKAVGVSFGQNDAEANRIEAMASMP